MPPPESLNSNRGLHDTNDSGGGKLPAPTPGKRNRTKRHSVKEAANSARKRKVSVRTLGTGSRFELRGAVGNIGQKLLGEQWAIGVWGSVSMSHLPGSRSSQYRVPLAGEGRAAYSASASPLCRATSCSAAQGVGPGPGAGHAPAPVPELLPVGLPAARRFLEPAPAGAAAAGVALRGRPAAGPPTAVELRQGWRCPAFSRARAAALSHSSSKAVAKSWHAGASTVLSGPCRQQRHGPVRRARAAGRAIRCRRPGSTAPVQRCTGHPGQQVGQPG